MLDAAAKPGEENLIRIVQLSEQPVEAVSGLLDAVSLHRAGAIDQHFEQDWVIFFMVFRTEDSASQHCGLSRPARSCAAMHRSVTTEKALWR